MNDVSSLIDTHAHIDGKEFDADFSGMLARAAAAGVTRIVAVAGDMESSRRTVELASIYGNIYCAVGVHPHDAVHVSDKCFELVGQLASGSEKCVAIGEIGLDFYRDRSPRDIQERVFRRFLILASELDLPVIIHDRDAHDRVLKILGEERARGIRGVLHCFSGDLGMARECIDLGLSISIPGTVTYPSNQQLRDVVKGVSSDFILLETDCPYLSPVPYRGKRNEPAHLRLVAEKVAEIKGLSMEDIARITTLNAERLFGIGQREQSGAIAYRIRDSLYLNITNRCTNRCSFCAKFSDFFVKGHFLKLDHEPSFAEVMEAVGDPSGYEEIVFCGYGEPLLRLDLVLKLAAALKGKGCRIRINTDGQANLVNGRNVLPELAGLVDTISVSLNAADAATYARLCRTPYGEEGFSAVCDFLREAGKHIPSVVASAVTVPGLDIEPVRKLAEELGVVFRKREYADVG
ncbi:MAG: TatD family nuclease-associated radical SAM protein [Geobacteraceae bacterium]|nr:TatD family nuclease-associated radical SAM protein [Geobacteraceae bacterium]